MAAVGSKSEDGRLASSKSAASSGKKVHYPFWFGGSASCCAAAVTHPLDLGKMSFWLLIWTELV